MKPQTQLLHPTALCLVLLLASNLPAAAAGGRAVKEIASLDLEEAALQLPLTGTLRLEGLQLETKGTSATAELERFRVFAPDAQIVLHGADGDTYLPAPGNAYFRGQLVGDPGSRVVLSVLEAGGARGLITSGGRTWIMGNAKGAKAASYALTVREIAPGELAGRSFSCDTDLLPPPPAQLPLTAAAPVPGNKTAPASYTARVAYETDQEYLDLFGGNTTDATNYIGDLTAHASMIYGTEVDTTWQVASVSLWPIPDPWTQQNRIECLLYEFGRYWNDNNPMPGTPVRTVAHMLNGTDTNGGLAWLNGLCTPGWSLDISADGCSLSPAADNYGGAYGLSGGIRGDFDINDPQTVWDIQVLVHEVGHNFNSRHTHCYENVGGSPHPVDPCSNEECNAGCWCGTPSLPSGCPGGGQGCGTIMSYCKALPGGLDNVALTLGAPVGGHPYGVMPERVPNLQKAYVAARAAAYPGCLDSLSGGPDAFEPDDTAGQASIIRPGVPQTHSIFPVGDEDWANFTLGAESAVTLETSGPSGDTRMWLRDAVLAEIDDDDDGGGGNFSLIVRTCGDDPLPAGSYFVQVDEYYDDDEIPSYDLSLTAVACGDPVPCGPTELCLLDGQYAASAWFMRGGAWNLARPMTVLDDQEELSQKTGGMAFGDPQTMSISVAVRPACSGGFSADWAAVGSMDLAQWELTIRRVADGAEWTRQQDLGGNTSGIDRNAFPCL